MVEILRHETTPPPTSPPPLPHRFGLFGLGDICFNDTGGSGPTEPERKLASFVEGLRAEGYAVLDGPRLLDLKEKGYALYVMLTHEDALVANDLTTVRRQVRAQKEAQSMEGGVIAAPRLTR